MKFGDSFHQRSIPEWSTHNIDYNDLKELIKRRTTKGNGEAQPIPGVHNKAKALQEFEDELYFQLKEQHARVDLFVRSKSGEYSRKLAHLLRQITDLERKSFSLGQTEISVRQVEKFSKLEDQTLKTGSDVQSLVQFANANRLALQKLLKKYKKWTGSSGLGQRFRREVLNQTSNLNSNFEPLVKQYIDTLASVREPFDTGVNWHTESPLSHRRRLKAARDPTVPSKTTRTGLNSSACDLYTVNQNGSRVELDTALATTPLGHKASRAVYWVHSDSVVQLQILLLQYTRIRNWSRSPTSSKGTTSSRTSPRVSISGQADDCVNTGGHEFGLIVCDDLRQFAARQSNEPVGDVEISAGTTAEKAAASIRYSSEKELLLAVAKDSRHPGKTRPRSFQITKFKRKSVRHLFDSSSEEDCVVIDSSDDSEQSRLWLAKHPDVRPLVQIQYRRSHFLGIRNTETAGIWATLDTEIVMRKCSIETISIKDQDLLSFSGGESSESQRFPLAILEIRIEGPDVSGLVATLDTSHLVTRIPGFSLETHAVAALCKPHGMPQPVWLPRLEEDMRKLPSSTDGINGRHPSKRVSLEQSDTRHTSISAPSTTNGQSSSGFSPVLGESSATSVPEQIADPPLSAFRKKRKPKRAPKKRRLPAKELNGPLTPSDQRYWNEFDDGSEGERDEPYTIFVDPNSPSVFPGVANISNFLSSLSAYSKASWEKVQIWLASRLDEEAVPDERSPLIHGSHSPTSPTIEDSSDSDNENSATVKRRSYSTMSSLHRRHAHSTHESLLFRCSLGSFATAFIFVIVAAIIVGTGRRKAATEVDIGVVICVAASAVFAVIGVGCTIARHDILNWVHKSAVGLTLLLVILANAGVLVGLSHVQALD